MKKRIAKAAAKIMAGAMAFGLLAGTVQPITAQAADNRLAVSKFDTAPTIDGKVDASEWGEPAFTVKDGEENISLLDEGGVFPADFSADIYLGYDSTHIYIAAVADYEIHKNEALLPTDLWQGDCMQIQISDTIGTSRNELGFTLNNLTDKMMAVAWASTGNFNMEGDKDYVVSRDGSTTTYEIALGVDQFSSLTELEDGMTLPFSLSFHMSGGGFIEYCAGIVQAKDINLAALIGLGAEPDESALPVVDPNAVNVNDTLLDSKAGTGNREVPGVLEAEDYDELYGTDIHINEECPDGTGNLGWTADGDYFVFKNVNFASVPDSVDLRVSGTGEPVVQIRLDAVDGTKIAEVKVTASGDWDTYTTVSGDVTDAETGTHDVYVLINGGMNINYIEFKGDGAAAAEEEEITEPAEEAADEAPVEEPAEEPAEASAPAAVESSGSNTVVIVVVVIVVIAVVAVVAVVLSKKKKETK